MAENTLSIKIGGQAGKGIKSAGQMLAKLATRSGYGIYTYTEFPSVIRGGHNVTQVIIGEGEVNAPTMGCDLLIALDRETFDRHVNEVAENGVLIFDENNSLDTQKVKNSLNLCPIPLNSLAIEAKDVELLENTVAIGAATAILGGDISVLENLLNSEFENKGNELVEANKKAARLGYDFAKSKYPTLIKNILGKKADPEKQMLLNGCEAIGLGAIAGGIQFASIYPMSPISNILHVLAKYQERYQFVFKQPEDEISAINMAIGASYAGARSLTSTSGGGFALMSEGYGLAGITETPVVIIEGMRPGPATGLPTWSGQGDLQFVLHAHQGEFPRIVLAAGDIRESFFLTMKAFNLAEKYQTPVVVLIDKNICDGDQSYPIFDISNYNLDRGKITREKNDSYKRYALSEDGVSTRSFPGFGNFFITNSDEHDEEGFSSEDSNNAISQQKKRMQKLASCENNDMEKPELFGPETADVTVVSWGSNKGSILTAIKTFPNVNFLHITWMNPFPTGYVSDVLKRAKYIIDVECNYTGQLANLIAEKTGIIIPDRFLKIDGRPVFPEEITDKLSSILKS